MTWVNISLAVFNLLPFPPLDGWKIAGALLPDRTILENRRL
jgi:Zn-dependent protease